MTNRLAIILILTIIVAMIYDAIWHDWEYSLFLARKGAEFLEWIKFWR